MRNAVGARFGHGLMTILMRAVWHETLTFTHSRTDLERLRTFQVSEGEEVTCRNTGVRNEIGGLIAISHWSSAEGVRLLLSERKSPPGNLQHFLSGRVAPAKSKIIVLKSALAWRATYGSHAPKVLYVDSPGLCPSNLSRLQYRRVPRPIYALRSGNFDTGLHWPNAGDYE